MDQYTAQAYVFNRNFRVGQWKLDGYQRLVGQENPLTGYSDLLGIVGTSVYQAGLNAGLTDVNGAAVTGAPVNSLATTRQMVSVCQGPQTPQLTIVN